MDRLWQDANAIISSSLKAVLPDEAVHQALENHGMQGDIYLLAVGKAAWQMANAAYESIGQSIRDGIVITKYDHSQGPIGNLTIYEAGHPVSDDNSYTATQAALDMVAGLSADDNVLFLISGGGSALFEKPLIPADEMQDITRQLLACGADIVEMNTVRKRLSAVKGGRFAEACPAKINAVVLSDILGDPLDMIASGPAAPDASTCEQAMAIAEKYSLRLSAEALSLLSKETPKQLDNVESHVVGSVKHLCTAAAVKAEELGYEPCILTDQLCCEARDAGSFLASIAKSHACDGKALAFIAGGETVVHLTGKGKGGRNQELALAAADGIAGLDNVLVFSAGSDGTDGPTDAAGGMVDGYTAARLADKGIRISDVLAENDAYNALGTVDCLIMTGPTGTNVNDVAVVLIS
ncbi:MAG: glycerate kinase [Mogibacterium sp.]|nr:glycerate kinase [Mogibacterium sp.]